MTRSPHTIPALLQHSARQFGQTPYLITPTDRLTYAQAERGPARVARWLQCR